METPWVETLKANGQWEDFLLTVNDLIAAAQRAQDRATTWEEAKEALGRKQGLQQLLRAVTAKDREERAYADFRGLQRVKSA